MENLSSLSKISIDNPSQRYDIENKTTEHFYPSAHMNSIERVEETMNITPFE